jgi:hypothetical protein
MSDSNRSPVPQKTEGDGGLKHISIKVKDDRENEVFFKIKLTTPLSKVMNAYCERQGAASNTLRFFFDNTRIQKDDTPAALEMEDGDMIDVHQEQQGGGGRSPSPRSNDEVKDTHLVVKVKDQNEGEVEFRIKRTTPLGKVMSAYCKTKEMALNSVRFLHDGVRLVENDTAESREMEDGETIQAFLQQQGGSPSPKPEVESKHVEIRVKDQNENEINFKVKRTTHLSKVMGMYIRYSPSIYCLLDEAVLTQCSSRRLLPTI